MGISKVREFLEEILKRKGYNERVADNEYLYPVYLSSLEVVELLLLVDKEKNEYNVSKLDINEITLEKLV